MLLVKYLSRRAFYVFMLVFSPLVFCAQHSKADSKLRDAVEFTPRSGLPNFFSKLDRGEDVTIAYFGGSITA